MLTNFGEIDADGFNQNIWEGIEEFGKRRDVFYSYVPTEVNSDNVLKSIKYAIDNGATIIVAPGYQYSNYICEAQQLYEDTYFVLIDTEPKDENDNIIYGNKTTSILFAEEESGFLAGYMAARENLNKYSFLGGLKNDNILRFNIGYLYGLFYAYDKYHDTLNLEDLKISIGYLNGFSEEEINKEVVTNVLNNTELVFVAAGSANHYVFNEANNLNIKLIGSDVNQAKYSSNVINSALKKLDVVLEQELTKIFMDNFKSGVIVKTIKDGATGLVTSDDNRFSVDDSVYNSIRQKLVEGVIEIDYNKIIEEY